MTNRDRDSLGHCHTVGTHPQRHPSPPTVRQGPKLSRSRFVIRSPLNSKPGGGSLHRRHDRFKYTYLIILPRRLLQSPEGIRASHTRQPHPDTRTHPSCVYVPMVMTARQLYMTLPWSRLLSNRPIRLPRVLSASWRMRQNAEKPSTMRTTELVRGSTVLRWRRRR
jgi:hypothetical protein